MCGSYGDGKVRSFCWQGLFAGLAMLLFSVPGLAQTNATILSAPPMARPGIDCDFFFPVPLQPDDGNHDVLQRIQQSLTAHDDMQQYAGQAFVAWKQSTTIADLEVRLAGVPTPKSVNRPDRPLWPQRARLWAACQRWEHTQLDAAMFNKYLLLLAAYNDWVVNSPPRLNQFSPCSVEWPLPDNAVRIAKMWTAFNNRFYPEVVSEAAVFDSIYGRQAETMNRQLPANFAQAETCIILKRGPVNDVAAERWMLAQAYGALNLGTRNDAAQNRLLCVDKGMVLDKTYNGFWIPADTVDRTKHHCPQ